MKKSKFTAASIACGFSLVLAAGGASADPLAINTTPAPAAQTTIIGSDTLNEVADKVVQALRAAGTVTQIATYTGLGSSQGQRQLEGNPNSGEPTCTPTDANGAPELNPGCEEIAPMSRQMNSTICDDEVSSGSNTTAEALAICTDGIVVVTDNGTYTKFADSTAQCATGTSPNTPTGGNFYTVNAAYSGAGNMRSSGSITLPDSSTYTIGANGTGWKDVLRLIYTGCKNDQGDCSAVTRTTRCSGTNNPTRQALVDNWGNIEDGVACTGSNACSTGLRAAYRRDDSSGTTGVFLSLLGLAAPIAGRTTLLSGVPAKVTAIAETHMFCDGGDNEGWLPGDDPALQPSGTGTQPGQKGDPIKKACLPEDDICNCDGTMGIVRAVRSPLIDPANPNAILDQNFPPFQCTRGSFASVLYVNSGLHICPDGKIPVSGNCKLPYFNDTSTNPPTKHFNCLNDLNSRYGGSGCNDGRQYNYVMRSDAGTVNFRSGNLPQGGLMRHNTRVLKTTLPVPGGPWPANTQVCEQVDATRQIGCLVTSTTCSMGWAGREAAGNPPYDSGNEAFRLNGFSPSDTNLTTVGAYPFSRDLYISAIGGFENITADCQARNGGASSQFCADEVAIASAFYNMTTDAVNACATSGFIPKAASECVGAQGSAGCGKPTAQAKTECLPQ